MRLCLACYNDRLAALFENADAFLVFTVADNSVEPAGRIDVSAMNQNQKINALLGFKVDTFVCGGIGPDTARCIMDAGISVAGWRCGSTEKVIHAFIQGRDDSVIMPGCRNRFRQCRRQEGTANTYFSDNPEPGRRRCRDISGKHSFHSKKTTNDFNNEE